MNSKIFTLIQALLFAALFIFVVPAQSQSADEQYNKAIESADSYFEKADYLNAKASYQVASQLKPDEQYPKDRMKESIDLLRVQMEKMAGYNAKLDYADQLFRDESWNSAILAYEEALRIMPEQDYPGQQISLIKDLQAEEAGKEAAYATLLKEGDDLMASANYTTALGKYEEAHIIYPSRQEVNDRIDQAEQKLDELAAQQSDYEKAISDAGMYHARKDYENELLSYQKAAELRPEESMPQIKIQELNEFLRKYEAYNSFVAEGDELYIAQRFAEAKIKYEKALEILPDENYPREIISKINVALAKKTEKDRAAYEEAIAKADALYNQEDYEAAMVAYSDALRFWPDGEHAQQRLGSISEIRALKKAKEEAYANSISLADKLFADEDYPGAKAEYLKASEIDPFQQYPKVRMDEIDMILAELQSKLDQYDAVIQGADKLFNVGDYEQARIQYLRAQDILSERSYPADQIRMIDEILGKEKATREDYDAAIARADDHFTKREWEDAKVDYVEANDLIPAEQYPKDKITEINNIMAQLKAEQETFNLAIKNADELYAAKDYRAALAEYQSALALFSDEEYPQQKIEEINAIFAEEARLAGIEESYAAAVSEGDKLFGEENYVAAKASYELALTLKPDEAYPKEKITDIADVLAALEAARLAEEAEQVRLRGIDESYNEAIAIADAFLAETKLNEAKAEYQRALTLKPDETYPQEKINEIDAKLAALAEQLEQYRIAIETADNYYNGQQYAEAREAYVRAREIKSDEPYPGQRISEIDGILANIEQQRAIDEGYANAIALGDNHFTNKAYPEAKAEYEKALGFKAREQYPKDKIAEIEGILGEQARLQQIEEDYNNAITLADASLAAERYDEARTSYTLALAAKPNDEYATGKITEIDGILAEMNRLQEIEDNYNNAIAEADAAFNSGNYIVAQQAFNSALGFKPGEAYPTQKLEELASLLDEQARQLAIDKQYNKRIGSADSLFALKEYENASARYTEALAVKSESYPQQKIDEINTILAEIARQKELDDNYAASVSNADDFLNRGAYMEALQAYNEAIEFKPDESYPKEKIAEINSRMDELEAERQKAYDAAIIQADNYYNMNNYRSAKSAYQTAVDIKSDETYARERLDEVTVLYMAELETLKVDYRKYIADADNYFNGKIYDGAIENYRIAAGILPDEPYPGQMIARITKIINDNAITDVNKLAQVIPNNTTKKFPFSELPVNVRKENYILIKARNVGNHAFKMVLNFGKDQSKNGGIVLQVPEDNTSKDYIIRIGAMYKWFSEDNNWLSIYPEGGDIEVALIRISKSD